MSAGIGGRTTAQGYTGDSVRQHFTGYEADGETGLNFAQARYQSPAQGRFTSVDPFGASAGIANPQSFNRYSYVINDPLNNVDPSGMSLSDMGVYQTDNPAVANTLENEMVRRVRQFLMPQHPQNPSLPKPNVLTPIPILVPPSGGPAATAPVQVDISEIGLPPPPSGTAPIPSGLAVVEEIDRSNACCIASTERTYQLLDQFGRALGGQTSEDGVFLSVGEEVTVVPGSVPGFPAKPTIPKNVDALGQFGDRPELAYPGGVAPLPDNTNRVVMQLIYITNPVTGARYDVALNRIIYTKGRAVIEDWSRGRPQR